MLDECPWCGCHSLVYHRVSFPPDPDQLCECELHACGWDEKKLPNRPDPGRKGWWRLGSKARQFAPVARVGCDDGL